MAVFSRALIVLTVALSVLAASVTEPIAATKVARGGGGDWNGGGGHGGGSSWGGHGGGGHNGGGHGGGGHNGGGHNGGGHNGGGHPHHPKPSHRPHHHTSYARTLDSLHGAQIAEDICPGDAYGCPTAPAGSLKSLPNNVNDWVNQGFYCTDPQEDLTDCGGCSALDARHDCTQISGAKSVSCVAGSCVVDSCHDHFTLSSNACTAD